MQIAHVAPMLLGLLDSKKDINKHVMLDIKIHDDDSMIWTFKVNSHGRTVLETNSYKEASRCYEAL